ncbi:phosphate ABC transporter substrate-binding protein PstS family protein [Natronorubrum sp. JWXQ-INN-674]|uniref:Phosphate ABC transporter substrate-binding protein PstS family protein n=1 Tax=Natronorubrum halalkaliphilum TaxID=2691917 RepID=A0A6B0VMM4_9EURY|nr:PstS family phosphate ABC transporter substrate-binding protein [Natronorubrum halalkaliphilum]MXV62463.1 phosphate ABC transporter substrate-binding protein PstS family protein [Natronorubrum halalkaliphilum]
MGNEPISGSDGAVSRRHVLLGTAGAGLTGLSGCLVRGQDSGLEGQIRIDGSNTLLPNSAAVAEQFNWENNRVRIPVRGSGTGAGFQKFCNGETEVQDASREIKSDEETWCAENGVEWMELEVVRDGIALYKNPANDWCECLTVDQLTELWQSGSTVETWSDLDDEWPDEELSLYGRDSASGTFDYFTEAIAGESGSIRSDYSGTPDTNVIVRGVRGNQYATGFGGAGYYYENEDDLELIAVDNGDGCVYPTPETIEEGEYQPLSRPMYIYVRLDALESEAYREFLRYYLDVTQETARGVGFYAVSDETIARQRERLEDAIAEYA